MRFYFAICLLVFLAPLHSQKENVNWHFGCFGGLKFGDGTVEIVPSALQSREGTASVSDADGNLLFYTDGISIYNGKNELVSDGLLGHPSSTSSAVVIPVRDSRDEYWIFTSDYIDGFDGVNYYRYNATTETLLEGPVKLFGNNTEKLAALKPCGRQNYWLATLDRSGTYRVYDVGTTVALSSTLATRTQGFNKRQMIAYLKFSEDGTKLASAIPYDDDDGGRGGVVDLFEFDPLTGQIGNGGPPLALDFGKTGKREVTGVPYGLQFSPSGEFLYVTTVVGDDPSRNGGAVYQYDLLADDIDDSRIQVGSASSSNVAYGALQIAPDGKIYMGMENGNEATSSCACFESAQYLGVINDPDARGTAVNFVQNGLYLGDIIFRDRCSNTSPGRTKIGLPTFVAASTLLPTINAIADTTICETNGLRLLRGNPQPGTTYTISGPNLSSQDYFVTVQPETSSTYKISASSSDCTLTSVEVTINVGLSTASLQTEVIDASTCEQDSLFGGIKIFSAGFLVGTRYDVTYSSAVTATTTRQIVAMPDHILMLDGLTPATYSIQVTSSGGCIAILPETVTVGRSRFLANPGIVVEGGGCAGATIILDADTTGGGTFTWSGPNNFRIDSSAVLIPSLSTADEGLYTLTRRRNGCESTPDSFFLAINPAPTDLGFDTTVCSPDFILDLTYPYAELEWSDGSSPGPRPVSESGTYFFSVITQEGCAVSDSIVLTVASVPEPTLPDELTVAECAIVKLASGLDDFRLLNLSWGGDFNICPSCASPEIFVDRPGTVLLSVTDRLSGCSSSDSTVISVIANQDVYVPNAFSPNGDGVNDGFTVYPRKAGTTIASLDIYDRWGVHLFHKQDFAAGNPALGWLGGEAVDNPTRAINTNAFVYIVVLRLTDGEPLSLKGMVTLVR